MDTSISEKIEQEVERAKQIKRKYIYFPSCVASSEEIERIKRAYVGTPNVHIEIRKCPKYNNQWDIIVTIN